MSSTRTTAAASTPVHRRRADSISAGSTRDSSHAHLTVGASDESESVIRAAMNQITGPITAVPTGCCDERRGGAGTISGIAHRKPGPADVQLTDPGPRHRTQSRIEHLCTDSGERDSDSDPMIHLGDSGDHRAFRRSVRIEHSRAATPRTRGGR